MEVGGNVGLWGRVMGDIEFTMIEHLDYWSAASFVAAIVAMNWRD